MTWIVGRDQQVLYKADWTSADAIRSTLNMIIAVEQGLRAVRDFGRFTAESIVYRARDWDLFYNGLKRNGSSAQLLFGKWLLNMRRNETK